MAMKAMKVMKKIKAVGVSYEVAIAKCGGRDRLDRAIEAGHVLQKGDLYVFKEHKHVQH